jgi:hypothetical protein
MFFRRRQKEDDDAQFGKLDELVGGGESNPVADGIRRALQREDLSPEDRADFEAALNRLNESGATEPPAESSEKE